VFILVHTVINETQLRSAIGLEPNGAIGRTEPSSNTENKKGKVNKTWMLMLTGFCQKNDLLKEYCFYS
jgi:hypothetical protein